MRSTLDDKVGLGAPFSLAGRQVYTNLDVSPTSGSGGLYWKYEEFIKKYESRTGSTAGVAGGALFGIRRELYTPLKTDFTDDFATSMLILAKGYRVITDPRCIGYQKSATNMDEEKRRRRRIASRLMSTYRQLRQQLKAMSLFDHWKFRSHKVLRWHTTEMFASILILNALVLKVHPAYVVLFFGQIGIYTLAFLGFLLDKQKSTPRILHLPYYFVYLNLVHFLGVIDALRGKHHTVWQPPKTSRTS